MIDKKTFSHLGLGDIKVVSSAEISKSLILSCKKIFENKYNGNISNFDEMAKAIVYNPDFSFIFIDYKNNVPVGFLFMLPATIETCKKFIKKEKTRNNLKFEDFDYDKNKNMIDLILYGSAFSKKIFDENNFDVILEYFIDAVLKKSTGGKYVNYVLFDTYTESEKLIASLFGAKKITDNVYGCLFNYKIFQNLGNGSLLQEAYTNQLAQIKYKPYYLVL